MSSTVGTLVVLAVAFFVVLGAGAVSPGAPQSCPPGAVMMVPGGDGQWFAVCELPPAGE